MNKTCPRCKKGFEVKKDRQYYCSQACSTGNLRRWNHTITGYGGDTERYERKKAQAAERAKYIARNETIPEHLN